MAAQPYFVAVVGVMPGATPVQGGTFYSIPSALSAADACQQAAALLIEQGQAASWFAPAAPGQPATSPWLLAVPASACQAIDLTPAVSASGVLSPVPAAPVVTASSDSLRNVSLAWQPTGPANKVVYTVQRGTVSGGPYTVLARQLSTGFTDPKLAAGTYFYVVAASNVNGQSASAEVAVTV